MAKKYFVLLLAFLIYLQSSGQSAVAKTGLPPFTLLLTNAHQYTYKDIQKKKAVVLIYFAPDCDHCRRFVKNLTDSMGSLKTAQVIMVSYFPLSSLQQFARDFKLERFQNIKIGTEGNAFLVPNYFKIIKFPFTALFDRDHKLVKTFREIPSLKVLSGYSGRL